MLILVQDVLELIIYIGVLAPLPPPSLSLTPPLYHTCIHSEMIVRLSLFALLFLALVATVRTSASI
jgi:hypothetical protein